MRVVAAVMLGASLVLVAGTGTAEAAPSRNHSPNQEEAFPVVCDGVSYTLFDAPASPDHAEFTPAFVTDTNKIVVPFSFDATRPGCTTDGTVLDGQTYNSGDIIFSESQSTA